MLENKPWSLQCVNWNKKINKINLSNLFGLLGNEKNNNIDEIKFNKFIGILKNEKKIWISIFFVSLVANK